MKWLTGIIIWNLLLEALFFKENAFGKEDLDEGLVRDIFLVSESFKISEKVIGETKSDGFGRWFKIREI